LGDTAEWVTPTEQELKDQNGKAEVVMIRGPIDRVVGRQALKFRRCELGNTNAASKDVTIGPDLKRVAVDKCRAAAVTDQHTVLVQVTNNVASLMNGLHRGSRVTRREEQEIPLATGLLPLSMGWAVHAVDGVTIPHLGHDEAQDRATRALVKSVLGPGDVLLEFGVSLANHNQQFLLVYSLGRPVVDLCHKLGTSLDAKDRPFPTATEFCSEHEAFAPGVHKLFGSSRHQPEP
jgi:hypothetical protein